MDESNEKFAFLVWFGTLGLNGLETKAERKTFYVNLTGTQRSARRQTKRNGMRGAGQQPPRGTHRPKSNEKRKVKGLPQGAGSFNLRRKQ